MAGDADIHQHDVSFSCSMIVKKIPTEKYPRGIKQRFAFFVKKMFNI
jgi:hypothetical protein